MGCTVDSAKAHCLFSSICTHVSGVRHKAASAHHQLPHMNCLLRDQKIANSCLSQSPFQHPLPRHVQLQSVVHLWVELPLSWKVSRQHPQLHWSVSLQVISSDSMTCRNLPPELCHPDARPTLKTAAMQNLSTLMILPAFLRQREPICQMWMSNLRHDLASSLSSK